MERNLTALQGPRGGGLQTPAQAAQAASVVNSNFYYSRTIFYAAKDGGNLFSYAQQTLKAFNYGNGDQMQTAVSTALTGLQATDSDTNLTTKNCTNNGEAFRIKGVGVYINGNSDAEVARQLFPELSLVLRFGPQQGFLLGPAGSLPGGGGLAGAGRQDITAAASSVSFFSNGWAEFFNEAVYPEGIYWGPQSEPDSQLTVETTLNRAIGVQGVVGSPATAKLDLVIKLFGRGERPRSRNI